MKHSEPESPKSISSFASTDRKITPPPSGTTTPEVSRIRAERKQRYQKGSAFLSVLAHPQAYLKALKKVEVPSLWESQ